MSRPGFQGREQDDETNAWEQSKRDMGVQGVPDTPMHSRSLNPGLLLLLLLVVVLVALATAVIGWVAADGDGGGSSNGGDRALAPRLPGDTEGVT